MRKFDKCLVIKFVPDLFFLVIMQNYIRLNFLLVNFIIFGGACTVLNQSKINYKIQNMRKIIAALNMTIDGICDHTAGIPDEEIHQHYTELMGQGDAILYGRTTYQLMEFWRTLLENPSDEKSMNDFAVAIDRIPKIVFSRTINELEWKSATIARGDLKEEVLALRQQAGKDIFVGSRSLILQLLQLGLIDEF